MVLTLNSVMNLAAEFELADRCRLIGQLVPPQRLLADLAEDRALARETKQVSAAIQATQLSAKLVGLLIERKESGAPGDFSNAQSPEDVLAIVRKELGLPEDIGGLGGLAEVLAVAEELGATLAPVPFLTSTVLSGQILAASGDAAAPWLERIAAGEIAAAAVTEAKAAAE